MNWLEGPDSYQRSRKAEDQSWASSMMTNAVEEIIIRRFYIRHVIFKALTYGILYTPLASGWCFR